MTTIQPDRITSGATTITSDDGYDAYVAAMRETATWAITGGLGLTFLPAGAKDHAQKDWPDEVITDLDRALNACSPAVNIAAVWQADTSNNTGDLEFEFPGYDRLIEAAGLPRSPVSFGSPRNPGSHFVYRGTGPLAYLKVTAENGVCVMEFRSGNRYSLLPPSLYPGGGEYAWTRRCDIPELEATFASDRFNRLGAMALLTYAYPSKGSRDDLAGALAGGLAQGRYSSDDVERMIEVIARVAVDDEVGKRVEYARKTVEKYNNGEAITGWKDVGNIIGKTNMATVRRLFGLAPSRGSNVANDLHDVSNADSFFAEYGDRFAHVEELGDLAFNGQKWCKGEAATAQIMRWAIEHAKAMAVAAEQEPNRTRREELRAWARASHSLSKIRAKAQLAMVYATSTVDKWDTDPMLFNIENGTLDLRTGRLKPHDPKDKITKIAPVSFDPDAPCPTWKRFMLDISNGDSDVVRYRQKMYGYALTADTREDVHHFLTGQGSNGKSLEVETMAKVFGEYAVHVRPESLAVRKGGATNDLARMAGARLVITTESDDGMRLDESMIKQLTGDTITARFLYRENFEFKPTAKVVMATNHRPVIRGTSHGIWRRIREIQYEVVFAEEWEKPLIKNAALVKDKDKTLEAQLEAELPGILNWTVRGCATWQAEGLEPIDKIKTWTAEYRDEQDVMLRFLAEKTRQDPTAKTRSSDLYWAYRTWCLEQGEEPMTAQKFGRRLTDLGFETDRNTNPKVKLGIALQETVIDGGMFPQVEEEVPTTNQPEHWPTYRFRGLPTEMSDGTE